MNNFSQHVVYPVYLVSIFKEAFCYYLPGLYSLACAGCFYDVCCCSNWSLSEVFLSSILMFWLAGFCLLTMLLCFRELVGPLLDNLSRKLQYATRSKVITIYLRLTSFGSSLAVKLLFSSLCQYNLHFSQLFFFSFSTWRNLWDQFFSFGLLVV